MLYYYLFSLYNDDFYNFWEIEKRYLLYAVRYYFQMPPYEQLTFIHVFQMIIGKVYEIVVLGSLANYIINTSKHNDNKNKENEPNLLFDNMNKLD